jgi:uncharacterized protein (DUF1697 family)
MKELVALLQGLGCRNVNTYIQSGNVVLRSDKDASRFAAGIAQEVEQRHGFEPSVMLLKPTELESAIAGNPFPDAEGDPKGLHYGFLDAEPSNPDLKNLEALRAESERFRLVGKVFYLYAPNGVGRSKLAANSERLLGVSMTDRNWRTVGKIRDMAEEIDQ